MSSDLVNTRQTLAARAVTERENRDAVNTLLALGEFFDPADTRQALDACGLTATALQMQAENHARRAT